MYLILLYITHNINFLADKRIWVFSRRKSRKANFWS